MIKKVAFLGMGVMGHPMAGHLVKAGYELSVYNRTAKKAQDWVSEYGGQSFATPALAVDGADLVIACLGGDEDVSMVCTGEHGAFEAMQEQTIFIDHSTISAKAAMALAKKAQKFNIEFLDAPVSGGQAGAQNGKLTIMVGGDNQAYDEAVSVMMSYARAVTYMGDSGAGQLTKMVNQICIAALLQGLSEGLAFSQKNNLDTHKVLDVISKGAAQSWQMENRGSTMVDDAFDFGFAVDHMRKDLGFCLDQAKQCNADLTVTQLVDDYYAQVQEMGGGRWDTSSLIKRLL